NDAEAAAVVAALGDLQIRIVRGGEPQSLWWHQGTAGLMRARQVCIDRCQHLLGSAGARDSEYFGMARADALGLSTETAGHQHGVVGLEGVAEGRERLVDGRIDEAAGIDYHQIRRLIARGDLIATRPQLRDQALRIDQGLGTTEADEADRR